MKALSALTARNQVEVQAPDGSRSHRTADPLSLFNVLRLKRAVGDNGHVGLTATSVARAERAGDAHVGALDWRWRSPSGDYVTDGQVVGSLLGRGPERTEPDGTVIAPGDLGSAVRLVLAKQGGARWLWNVWAARDGRELQVNDLGYNDRANQFGAGGELTWRSLEPRWHTLESDLRLSTVILDNLDRLPTQRTVLLGGRVLLASFWTVIAGVGGSRPRFDDREVGDGAALERPGGVGGFLKIDSDPRARVFAHLDSGVEAVTGGGRSVRGELALQLRTLPQLDLELIPQAVFTRGEYRFATTAPSGEYLFGKLAAHSLGLTLRATYTFTPRLTLQAYAQLFLSARHYQDFASFQPGFAGPRPAIHLHDLVTGVPAPATNPDTQDAALNANVVLRWELRPGSLLYLVYTRAQAPQLTLLPGESGRLDLHSLRRAPASDVLLLKLAWWFG